jgi:hypothetical protein
MKKTLLTLISSVAFLLSVNAQLISSYAFTQNGGTYTPITGGSVLGDTSADEQIFIDPSVLAGTSVFTSTTGVGFPIGFNFTYNGIVFDRLGVCTNGWISLGQSSLTPSIDMESADYYLLPLSQVSAASPAILRNRIGGFAVDLKGQTGSEIRVQTTGTTPNRVCVVQWTNFRRYGTTGPGSHYNFQIRLNESNNSVNVVYGTMTNPNTTSTKAQVGLSGTTEADFNLRKTTTSWTSTVAATVNTDTCSVNPTLYPANGLTFTWNTPPACTGAPTAGTASAPASVCSGINFNLTLTGYTTGVSGITLQWQSATSLTGTYTNISNATTSVFTTSQTATTYYKCVVSCAGGSTVTSNVLTVSMNAPSACYCTPVNGGSSCIKNVTFNTTLNHNSPACENGPTYYTAVPVGTSTTTITGGSSYPLAVTIDSLSSAILSVWIDYNQNGSFEASEWTQIATNAVASSTSTVSIVVPGNAVPGQTRMRVRSRAINNPNGATDACTSMASGETEDYIITINAAPICTGTPTIGAASGPSAICSGVSFPLSLAGYSTTVSGLTFQWQSSSSLTGTYTNISGATTPTYTASQTATTYYKCVVTCSGSASATSNVVTVTLNPYTNCYCSVTSSCSSSDVIKNVTLNNLNNTTTCGAGHDSLYTATIPSLHVDSTYSISVSVGSGGTEYVSVWIDYNQNGTFETSEYFYVGAGNNVTVDTTFTVPANAFSGNTRMRVRARYNVTLGDTSACLSYGYGETEDYIVNITGGTGLGIQENELLNNINIYPNPTTGVFNIEVNEAKFSELAINVIDIQGKLVYTSTDKNLSSNYNKQINLEGLAKGLYYIKLSTNNGVKVKKLIIQ